MEKTLTQRIDSLEPGKMEEKDIAQEIPKASELLEHSTSRIPRFMTVYYAFGMIAIVSSIFFILYFVYLMFYPVKTLEYPNDEPFKVLTKEVTQGDDLIYETDICKYFEGVGHISFQFIDSIVYTTPPIESNLPLGCHQFKRGVLIPLNLPPGKYTLAITVVYKVNPFRDITITKLTESFNVVEREK